MSFLDRFEGKLKWAFHPWFFVGVVLLVGLLGGWVRCVTGKPISVSAALAAYGAFMACCGVVTIGRPMIRVGGYRAWHEQSRIIDGGHIVPTPEEIEEDRQGRLDAMAVQVTGPALVIVGTMLNGISGFF